MLLYWKGTTIGPIALSYKQQADALDAHPDWAICFHQAGVLPESGVLSGEPYPSDDKAEEWSLEELLVVNPMHTCTVVFRNHLFDAFPDWYFQIVLGDWPLHILNAQFGKAGFLKEQMAIYRIHSGGHLVLSKLWPAEQGSVVDACGALAAL